MLRNPKTRGKPDHGLMPPSSPACLTGLDLASAVSSYTPRTLTAHDIPEIPVYNREKNRIQRFSRVASVPVYGSGVNLSKVESTAQNDAMVIPKLEPALTKPQFNDSSSEYSDLSSEEFSDRSMASPAGKRNSIFDSPGHKRDLSAGSNDTGPSRISDINLAEEVDNMSFYDYYFNKAYFDDVDSLFSGTSGSQVPPKYRNVSERDNVAARGIPKQSAPENGPSSQNDSKYAPAYEQTPKIYPRGSRVAGEFPQASRRIVSDCGPRKDFQRKDVCLDLCADYENSRFMIPRSYQVQPVRRARVLSVEQKSLPQLPNKAGIRQRIFSETNRFSRIFSK